MAGLPPAPVARSVAAERNATRVPSSLIDGRSLVPLPAAPAPVLLTRLIACDCWSRTKTSVVWLASLPTRFVALEVKASQRPSRLRLGSELAPVGSPPPVGWLARSMAAQLANIATHATTDIDRI